MNARPCSLSALIVVLACAGVSLAQTQPVPLPGGGQGAQSRPGMPQPRDPRQDRPQTGTASVSGRVTAAETGTPLRRVQVRVMGQEVRGSRGAMTDAEGRYTIANLPAGRYSIMFVKSGFANMQYGQKRPNQPGKAIDLVDGQKLDQLDVALIRGGVIAGRIVDDFGEPVVEARVQALQIRWVNGRRRVAGGFRGNQTNDRGEYRIWGLGPGEYFVSASSTDRQMFFDPRYAALDANDSSGFAPTYYPGTASVDEAQKVAVAAGQEVGGVDFALVPTRLLRVSGTALASDGRPMAGANVMMFPRSAIEGGMMMTQGGGRTDSDGSFLIPNVAPGDYVIRASRERGPGAARGTDGDGVASANITVGSEDVKNVTLVAPKGVRVSGRVVFEGGQPSPEEKDRLAVFMPSMENDGPMFGPSPGESRVTAEGTFDVRGVSGRRTLSVSAGPAWMLKAVRIGGADILDTGYEFGKEDVSNVEIVLTNRLTTLTGTVKGDNNAPALDYVVIAYSTDESAWDRPMARRSSIGRPDQNGTYKVVGLRPGSYYVVALPEMPEEWGDPEIMKTLKDRAKRVTLREGESETLELVLQQIPGN